METAPCILVDKHGRRHYHRTACSEIPIAMDYRPRRGSIAGDRQLGRRLSVLILYVALHVPIGYLWWFWSVGFDGTHIFGTASRTFFDSEARAQTPRACSSAARCSSSPSVRRWCLLGWKGWLALLVGVWAYYHVIRQHYGFMVLYKVKNRDLARLDKLWTAVSRR